MTGRQLYEQAITLLGLETAHVPYLEQSALGCINQMLSDRLYEHNALQHVYQQSILTAAPVLHDIEEEIPYQEMFVRECFPYGLAALLIAEEDRDMFNWLMSEYERRCAYYAPCTFTAIREMGE